MPRVPATGAVPSAAAPLSAVTALLLLIPGSGVPEQFLDPPPLLLQPVQRQAQVPDGVPDHVVGLLAVHPDREPAPRPPWRRAPAGQFPLQRRGPLVDLD